MIQYRNGWYPVEGANANAVSIRSRLGGSWTDRIPYHQISDPDERRVLTTTNPSELGAGSARSASEYDQARSAF